MAEFRMSTTMPMILMDILLMSLMMELLVVWLLMLSIHQLFLLQSYHMLFMLPQLSHLLYLDMELDLTTILVRSRLNRSKKLHSSVKILQFSC